MLTFPVVPCASFEHGDIRRPLADRTLRTETVRYNRVPQLKQSECPGRAAAMAKEFLCAFAKWLIDLSRSLAVMSNPGLEARAPQECRAAPKRTFRALFGFCR
jgi:hypothetical protein